MTDRTYTTQDVIELFNGDQAHIFEAIALSLNAGSDVGAIIKREINFMARDAEDAAELLHIEEHGNESAARAWINMFGESRVALEAIGRDARKGIYR